MISRSGRLSGHSAAVPHWAVWVVLSGPLRERWFTATCDLVCDVSDPDTPRQVHLRMGSTRRARILLKACLGQLLANAPVQSQGEAWLAMAKCEMAEVSLEGPCSSAVKAGGSGEIGGAIDQDGDGGRGGVAAGMAQRGGALKRAVLHLDRAIAMLKRCHDFAGLRECFYLKVGSFFSGGAGVTRPGPCFYHT